MWFGAHCHFPRPGKAFWMTKTLALCSKHKSMHFCGELKGFFSKWAEIFPVLNGKYEKLIWLRGNTELQCTSVSFSPVHERQNTGIRGFTIGREHLLSHGITVRAATPDMCAARWSASLTGPQLMARGALSRGRARRQDGRREAASGHHPFGLTTEIDRTDMMALAGDLMPSQQMAKRMHNFVPRTLASVRECSNWWNETIYSGRLVIYRKFLCVQREKGSTYFIGYDIVQIKVSKI